MQSRHQCSPGFATSSGTVELLSWPGDRAAVEASAPPCVVRLVIVDDGQEPPIASNCCQDWMWRSGSDGEFRMRVRQLLFRSLSHGWSRPTIDEFGVLHVALRSVPLPPGERKVAAALLEQFDHVVLTEEVIRVAWPDGVRSEHVVAVTVSRLRSRVAAIGIDVRAVAGRGYVMTPRTALSTAEEGQASWFDDEIEPPAWRAEATGSFPAQR